MLTFLIVDVSNRTEVREGTRCDQDGCILATESLDEALSLAADGGYDAITLCSTAVPARDLAWRLSEAQRRHAAPPILLAPGRFHRDYVSELDMAGVNWTTTQSLEPADLQEAVVRCKPSTNSANDLGLVGVSDAVRRMREVIRLVAPRTCTVLVSGETGTGKEVLARALHTESGRSREPFIAINCAALPATLLETELFGHVRGAFTGAERDHKGRFQQASGGTIFLDEIGDMPLEVQAKLLRVLQEKVVYPLGGSKGERLDVRVIAATNANLKRAVDERSFRADLYYRLNVVPLEAPPLRERPEDVEPLVRHFVSQVCQREGLRPKGISSATIRELAGQPWPGNVRELEHAIERAVALSGDRNNLDVYDFALDSSIGVSATAPLVDGELDFERLVNRFQRALIDGALQRAVGNKARAAQMLHLKRSTLVSKLKALEMCA